MDRNYVVRSIHHGHKIYSCVTTNSLSLSVVALAKLLSIQFYCIIKFNFDWQNIMLTNGARL